MRILISNDDGINAPGLLKLKQALDPLGEVLVVAPDRERSGTGHGITVHKPLRPKQISFSDGTTGWSVNGTPADCVKLGIEALMDDTPDIVISGINWGANLGTDVLYSGTVSAAIEGIINGIPSVAISLATYENKDFESAARFAARVVPVITENKFQRGCSLININVPPGSPKGVKVTRLGNRRYENVFHKRIDPRGGVYYWMAGEPKDMTPERPKFDADIDFDAVNNGFISITPLHFDLTDFNGIGEMEKIIGLIGESSL
ncbi:5'/3'-nucleotidase SurE [Desulfotruncus alcoholivorax]|uniref:5'/3'-nucleotidase SurE n=1 Tax=Desulfotruncus alcoholivorax TaxID=265477 RepID=UPI0003FF6973|nr:5'/3'-nucleotidase SurE [Desulfotruncus alcoholivorax]